MKTILVLIPARGGSKGILRKNLKEFNGQPLIKYSIDYAKKHFAVENICVSSDSTEIIEYVKELGLDVPFRRPDVLAQDKSGTREVILHALDFFKKNQDREFDYVLLLQPTTPVRNDKLVEIAADMLKSSTIFDMLVSVKITKSSPYFNLFEENQEGYLKKSKGGRYIRRQDSPTVYEYTGAFYLIKVQTLLERNLSDFECVKKIVVESALENIDLDTPLDWEIGEYLVNNFKQL